MPLNDVSHETKQKLEQYYALLLKWQKAINLVSGKTINDAWPRHFEDSLQVLPLIPEGVKTLYDLGSGGGFPGLIIAICRPDIHVHLIESDERKGQFLRTVSRETGVPVTVHTQRIEAADLPAPDMVSARALADLEMLCGFCEGWAADNPVLQMVFMKGRNAAAEIKAAGGKYDFDAQMTPSVTEPDAAIITLQNLRKKQG